MTYPPYTITSAILKHVANIILQEVRKMISTGIVRSIDSLGRVVLPKELRTTYDITPDTPLEIFTDGDSIIMRKYHAQGSCVFCGDISPDAVLLHGKYVCPACRKALGK